MSAEADRMARARAEFSDALRLGISIPALRARREADRRYLRERAGQAVGDHTDDLMDGFSKPSLSEFQAWDADWMMRD